MFVEVNTNFEVNGAYILKARRISQLGERLFERGLQLRAHFVRGTDSFT